MRRRRLRASFAGSAPIRHRHRPAAIVALLLGVVLASACTPLHWDRPNTDAATVEADRRECIGISRRQAVRINDQPLFVPYFVTVRDTKGRVRSIPVFPYQQVGPPVWMPYAPHLAIDRNTLQNDLFRDCMEEKSYELVPAEKQAEDEGARDGHEDETGDAQAGSDPAPQSTPAAPSDKAPAI